MQGKFNSIEYIHNSKPARLRLHLTIKNTERNRRRYFGFVGNLYLVIDEAPEAFGEGEIRLNDAVNSTNTIIELDHDKSSEIDLDFILDPYVKNTIEEYRDGNLRLRIDLHALSQIVNPDNFDISQLSCPVSHKYRFIEIPRSEWSDILREAGYTYTQIIEIPITYNEIISTAKSVEHDDLKERLSKAATQLETVMKYMNLGEWSIAVSECRKIIEFLSKDVKEHVKLILRQSGYQEKQVTAFDSLINQLKALTSAAHHVGDEEETFSEIHREDALFIVTNIATLVNLISRKINRLKK